MANARRKSVVLTVVGILLAAAAVFGLLLIVNADAGFSSCTGTTQFGWMAPLLAASIIGGLAWILLGQEPRNGEKDIRPSSPCPACGRVVLGEWRLCPHCGAMLPQDRESGESRLTSD